VNRPAVLLAVALLVVAPAVAFVVVRPRRLVVEGTSMEPTVLGGDRLLVVRRPSPRVGDIVALPDPRNGRRLLVKRLTAVVGTELIVEGDNRGSSTDSRDFGPVAGEKLMGRAVYRYGPAGRTGRLSRRIGLIATVGTDSGRGTIRA
jgi:nickel-type superoxide dismutase maturation protease